MNLGRLIREQREQKGYRIRDLADDQISIGTISKIENGGNCQDRKIKIYLKKLGLTTKKLKQLAKQDEIKKNTMHFVLMALESNIDTETVTADEIDSVSREFEITPLHPYYSTTRYLHGKRLLKKRQLNKANEYFFDALNDRSPEDNEHLNIAAASYNELAYISYLKNDLNGALVYIDKGLGHIVKDGERQYVESTLLINKAVFLEKCGNIDEAESVLDELNWSSLNIVGKAYNFVLLHQVKADILIAKNKYDKAIEILKKGIELARINRLYNLQFSLWITLGTICLKHGLIDVAVTERCYRQALRLSDKIDNKKLLISSYQQISLVYMKMEKWDLAHQQLNESIELARKHDDGLRHIIALLTLGRLYSLQSYNVEANIKYREALELARKYKFLNKQSEIKFLLSKEESCTC